MPSCSWAITTTSSSKPRATLKKGDERKLALAAVIRQRTTVPNVWIARELQLGHVSRVSRCWQTKPEEGSLVEQLLSKLDP
jgi:hypothetical protein